MILNFKLFEKHILNVNRLNDLKLALRTPQVGCKNYEYDISDDYITIHDSTYRPDKKYDFVILTDGTLLIGVMHYKLSGLSRVIKAAGELKINLDGKISYINNQSGHYQPTEDHLLDISIEFEKLGILSNDVVVDSLY